MYKTGVMYMGRSSLLPSFIPIVLIAFLFFCSCAPAPYIYITNFEVTPNPLIEGEAATLHWNVTGANTVSIDNGIGEVPPYGKYSITPSESTTYTLTAKNTGRSVQAIATANVTISLSPSVDGTTANPINKITGFVFQSFQNNWDIWYVKEDGSGKVNLTNSPKNEWQPAWSPDGSRIAFVSDKEGSNQIYVMEVDGSNVTRLTNTGEDYNSPTWSPDGLKIAFVTGDKWPAFNVRMPMYLSTDIYIMDCDGKNSINLTSQLATSGSINIYPAWSPDGKKLAFINMKIYQTCDNDDCNSQFYRAEKYPQIYVQYLGENRLVNVTNSEKDSNVSPCWSADSSKIAFYSNREDSTAINDCWKIYIATLGDGKITKLSDQYLYGWGGLSRNYEVTSRDMSWNWLNSSGALYNGLIHWSPDGRKIAFMSKGTTGGITPSGSDEKWSILLIDPDGTNLLDTGGYVIWCRQLTWSPDSEFLAFIPPANRFTTTWVNKFDNIKIMDVNVKQTKTIFDCKAYDYLQWR
jgi:Tol biopolymer transport system component